MHLGSLRKLENKPLMQVFDVMRLSPEEIHDFHLMHSHSDIINHWIAEEDYQKVCYYLACTLPLMECLWWGWVVADTIHGHMNEENKIVSTSRAIEQWLKQRIQGEDADIEIVYRTLKNAPLSERIVTNTMPMYWIAAAVLKVDSYDKADKEKKPLFHQFIVKAITTTMSMSATYIPTDVNNIANYIKQTYRDVIRRGLHIAAGGNGKLGNLQLTDKEDD